MPKTPWNGVFESNKHEMCVQVSFLHKNTLVGTEDCLVLSVSVPKSTFDKQNPLPVMVWIHGGGFTQGSGSPDTYGTERLMDYGIIGKVVWGRSLTMSTVFWTFLTPSPFVDHFTK